MERELWPLLYPLIQETAKDFQQKYVRYQPWLLVTVFLWAALHDRSIAWACQRRHWSTTTLQPVTLPSPSTMSRRSDGVGVGLFWNALEQRLRNSGVPALVAFVDGKPLPIGGNSKDPDARFGRGAGCIAKGYKWHAIFAGRSVPEAWEVTPLNANEAAVRGYQLVAPVRACKEPGSGKHYQSPHRLRSIALRQGQFGKALYRARTAIERSFGNACSFGGGLGPLPAWVRGQARVRTWVWAKLLINAVRIERIRT